jgi:Tfp pilus assembly protein PilF
MFGTIGLHRTALVTARAGLRWSQRQSAGIQAIMYDILAQVYIMMGQAKSAIAMLRESHSRAPIGGLNFRIATAYERCHDRQTADEYYRRALSEDDPADTESVRHIILARLNE